MNIPIKQYHIQRNPYLLLFTVRNSTNDFVYNKKLRIPYNSNISDIHIHSKVFIAFHLIYHVQYYRYITSVTITHTNSRSFHTRHNHEYIAEKRRKKEEKPATGRDCAAKRKKLEKKGRKMRHVQSITKAYRERASAARNETCYPSIKTGR